MDPTDPPPKSATALFGMYPQTNSLLPVCGNIITLRLCMCRAGFSDRFCLSVFQSVVLCPDHTPKGEGLVAFVTFLGTVRKITNFTNKILHLTEV